MAWDDAFPKLEAIVWILKHVLRSITCSLFTLKASNLVKCYSHMIFHAVVSIGKRFETRPSYLRNFGMA